MRRDNQRGPDGDLFPFRTNIVGPGANYRPTLDQDAFLAVGRLFAERERSRALLAYHANLTVDGLAVL